MGRGIKEILGAEGKIMNKKIIFLLIIFCFISKIFTAELDQLPVRVSGSSYTDAIDWMESARTKYISGVWFHETDDWRPIFLVTIHNFLKWVSYSVFGLTDLGFKFWEIFFVVFIQGILLSRIPIHIPNWQKFSLAGVVIFSGVLLAASRQATLDTVQVGIIFSGFYLLLRAMESGRSYLWFFGSVIVNIGVLYKLSALLMAGVPFALLVFLHFNSLATFRPKEWVKFLTQPALIYSAFAAVLVFGVFFVFFLRPYGDEFTYMSWRIFGVKANIIAPWDYRTIARNFLNLVSTGWTNTYDTSVRLFHAHWIGALLLLYPISLRLAFDPKTRKPVDVLVATLIPIFFFQIILFDMQWRRYFILIPIVYLFVIRIFEFFASSESAKSWETPSWIKNLTRAFFFYGVFIFVSKIIFHMNWMDSLDIESLKQRIVPLFFGTLVAMAAVFATFFIAINHKLKTAILISVLFFFSLDSIRGAYELFLAPKTLSTSSKKLNNLVEHKDAKVFMDSELHLYHNLRVGYVGSWSGGWKPESRWENNLTLREYTYKVITAGKTHPDFRMARSVARMEKVYPGFMDRWNLPLGYEEKFKSKCLIDGQQQLAKKFLLVGCSEPKVYFALFPKIDGKDRWIYHGILEQRKNQKKIGELTIRDDFDGMESIFDFRFQKTRTMALFYSEIN
jgi:hypothetical protein